MPETPSLMVLRIEFQRCPQEMKAVRDWNAVPINQRMPKIPGNHQEELEGVEGKGRRLGGGQSELQVRALLPAQK